MFLWVVLFLGSESEVSEPILPCGFNGHLDFAIRFCCRKEEEERKEIYSGSGTGGRSPFELVGQSDYTKPKNARWKALTKTRPHGR